MALAVRSARRRDRRGPLSSMGISKIQTERKKRPRRSGADARFKVFVFYGHHPVVPAAGNGLLWPLVFCMARVAT